MINVILCGGSGTRLWPVSRKLYPKQFVKLFDGKSLFQETAERNLGPCDGQVIVAGEDQYFLAMDQLAELTAPARQKPKFILEPVGRNTAPAIALACMALPSDEVVLVTPSDHRIKNTEAYRETLARAEKLAKDGHLVTFGITPTYPETGYGYIEANGEDVVSFKEKPDADTAKAYVDAGNYHWNSGMFVFMAGTYLAELSRFEPMIAAASLEAYQNAVVDDLIRIKHDDMAAIPADSIDFAVLERSMNVKVVAADIGWSDLGSFDALYDELEKDDNGNASLITGNFGVINENASGNLVVSDNRHIALVDVEDLFVVDTSDALLIGKRGASQDVKKVVDSLKKRGNGMAELTEFHTTVHRPWGSYTVLEVGDGYKMKRIVVKPGKKLSLQKHEKRSEHWVVVSGTAEVTVDDAVTTVNKNESSYIPIGAVHRLANHTTDDLIIIEAQVGEYTGEDDIIRIEDDYHRGQ